MPSSNADSSSAGATETLFSVPRTSVNHNRTKRISRSSSVRSTNSCCRSTPRIVHPTGYRLVTHPAPSVRRPHRLRAARRTAARWTAAGPTAAGGVVEITTVSGRWFGKMNSCRELPASASRWPKSIRASATSPATSRRFARPTRRRRGRRRPPRRLSGDDADRLPGRGSGLPGQCSWRRPGPPLTKLATALVDDGLGETVVLVGYLDADGPAKTSSDAVPGHGPRNAAGGPARWPDRRHLLQAPPAQLRCLRRGPLLRAGRHAHRRPASAASTSP